MPESVADFARQLWSLAVEASQATLDQERKEMVLRLQETDEKVAQAEDQAILSEQRTEAAEHALAVARETITARNTEIRRLEQLLGEMQAVDRAKDERIEGLTEDFSRKEKEYAARVTELDGLRKRALLDIDTARQEGRYWKAEFDRVNTTTETYRQKAAALVAMLAETRGRLSGVEDSLTATRQRQREPEAELAKLKAASNTLSSPASRRFGANAKIRGGQARMIVRRKL